MATGDLLEVRGLEKLARVSALLKDAPKEMQRELYRELNSITKPLRAAMRDEIPNALPRRGGLAARVQQRSSFTASARKGGAFVGVSIRARGRKGTDVRMLESGRLRHPVFGNRRAWVEQTAGVREKALTKVFESERGHILYELDGALDRLAAKLANKAD